MCRPKLVGRLQVLLAPLESESVHTARLTWRTKHSPFRLDIGVTAVHDPTYRGRGLDYNNTDSQCGSIYFDFFSRWELWGAATCHGYVCIL